MIPTEKLGALRALAAGLSAVTKAAEEEVRQFRASIRAKAGFETAWGDISFRRNPAKLKYDQSKLLPWAQENMPHEVIPEHQETVPEQVRTVPATVRETLYKTLDARLAIEGDQVVDIETGEVVDFAIIEPAKPDSVVFTMPEELKAEAARLVSERVDQVAAALRPELKP